MMREGKNAFYELTKEEEEEFEDYWGTIQEQQEQQYKNINMN